MVVQSYDAYRNGGAIMRCSLTSVQELYSEISMGHLDLGADSVKFHQNVAVTCPTRDF